MTTSQNTQIAEAQEQERITFVSRSLKLLGKTHAQIVKARIEAHCAEHRGFVTGKRFDAAATKFSAIY